MRKTLSKRLDLPDAAPAYSTGETTSQYAKRVQDACQVVSSGETAGQIMKSAGKSSWSIHCKPQLMLQLLGLTVGLSFSVLGNAVGMGGINVVSALGQPLKAEIELVAVNKADKPGLVARLASPDAYKGAGLDYPYGIKYNFQLENRANGESYLKLSSNHEINDPFVSLLVELSWASGKLMREYTFLLDPPGYVAAQPKSVTVQPLAPAAVESYPAAPVKQKEAKPVAIAVEQPVEKQSVAVSVKSEAPARVATGSITVRSGDSLNKIAAQLKTDEVSLERMLVALYRANTEQFDGKNMNRIKVGKILRRPDQNDVMSVAQAEAVQEIRVQSDDWHAYRQKLAGAATSGRQAESAQHVATGKISTPAADKTPVASDSAKEVLRLSKGEAPGGKTGGAGRSVQDKHNAAAEEAIAKSKAISEEKARVALLESNLKDMQRLAKLKTEAAALAVAASKVAAATAVASEVVASSAVAAASNVVAASQVAAASNVAAASAVKPAPVEIKDSSIMDDFLNSPLAMGVGAAILLGLGGLGIALSRRRQKPAAVSRFAEDEVGTTTTSGQLTTPVVPSPDTGDFTSPHSSAEEVIPQHDDVDPISEADLFLNFGRDEQAEEVLKDALLRSPDNQQVRLKLLGIYANRRDVQAFSRVESQLQDSGDAQAIEQAAEIRLKMNLSNPIYTEEAGIEDADSATMLTAAIKGVTTDKLPVAKVLDESDTGRFDVVEDGSTEQVEHIDFDVTATHPFISPVMGMDFDVTSTSPSLTVPDMLDFDIAGKEMGTAVADQHTEAAHHEEEALPNLDDLIFDVMSVPEPLIATEASDAVEPVVEPLAAEEYGMEFTLDFPSDDHSEKMAHHPAVVNLSDISLDLGDATEHTSEVAATEDTEQWHEVATKLDLARAYQEMGDEVGAREILDEVMLEGDEGQRQEAQLLIKQLG